MLSPSLVSNPTSAWAAGNSLVFGEYILLAANVEPTRWTLRLVGFACMTFALLIHGVALRWGLRLQNFLGIFKDPGARFRHNHWICGARRSHESPETQQLHQCIPGDDCRRFLVFLEFI